MELPVLHWSDFRSGAPQTLIIPPQLLSRGFLLPPRRVPSILGVQHRSHLHTQASPEGYVWADMHICRLRLTPTR